MQQKQTMMDVDSRWRLKQCSGRREFTERKAKAQTKTKWKTKRLMQDNVCFFWKQEQNQTQYNKNRQ
jgi:hypothetical protein